MEYFIKEIYKDEYLKSACIFSDNIYNYIITCNDNYVSNEKIKVINYKLKMVEEINDSNERKFFTDTYYDNKKSTIYIITGNLGYIKSYDYNNNKIYQKYNHKDDSFHESLLINKNKDIIQLIDSCIDGTIRIWDFHLGLILNKITVEYFHLYGICLYKNGNNEYLFAGSSEKNIILIDLKKQKVVNILQGHNDEVLSVKTIIKTEYEDLLISQGFFEDGINIWSIKKYE